MNGVGELDPVIGQAIADVSHLMEVGTLADPAAEGCPYMRAEIAGVLAEYLEQLRAGKLRLTTAKNEARAWIEMVVGHWPFASLTARAVLRALTTVLATTEPAPAETGPLAPMPEPPVETRLEHAIEAVRADPGARAGLWRALWDATIFLPVASVDFERDPAGAVYRFVTARIGNDPVIFGFTTEARLRLLDPGEPTPAGRVEVRGDELGRFWPDDHWLVLNPGFALTTTLSPAEVRGLPQGPRLLLPDDDRYPVIAPADDEVLLGRLAAARKEVGGIEWLRWAVLRPEPPGRPRDVLVVTPAAGTDASTTLAAFTDAVARAGFAGALVLSDTGQLQHGLTAQVAAVGRLIV